MTTQPTWRVSTMTRAVWPAVALAGMIRTLAAFGKQVVHQRLRY